MIYAVLLLAVGMGLIEILFPDDYIKQLSYPSVYDDLHSK